MRLIFAGVLALCLISLVSAQATVYTSIDEFDTAASGAGDNSAQVANAAALNARFQGVCIAGQSFAIATTFANSDVVVLQLECAVDNGYDENTCIARMTQQFQIAGSCKPGDTLDIYITNGPAAHVVC